MYKQLWKTIFYYLLSYVLFTLAPLFIKIAFDCGHKISFLSFWLYFNKPINCIRLIWPNLIYTSRSVAIHIQIPTSTWNFYYYLLLLLLMLLLLLLFSQKRGLGWGQSKKKILNNLLALLSIFYHLNQIIIIRHIKIKNYQCQCPGSTMTILHKWYSFHG